ncbi:MAG: hypothetical protein H7Z15_09910 [Rhizobacter sp.]|nr:hypothetical protein [Rhizobacter sp.]
MEQANQAMQSAMQPLLKLTQANMELLTQFSTSPEVMAQSMATAQNMLQQGQKSASGLAQSNAFAQLTQGILKNYTEFVTELSQSGMAALAQGQAEMVRRAQEAGGNVIDASTARSKRTR